MSGCARTILAALLAAVALGVATRDAAATQHFVKPGEDLLRRPPVLRPGDEVILWPGKHAPIRFQGIAGTKDQPIVIRGLDPRNPPTIEAAGFGIQLVGARHVRIEHINVTGARIAGIRIEPGEGIDRNEDISLASVMLGPTDPKDTRHGLVVRATDGLQIDGLVAERWGGHAILLEDVTDAAVRDVRLVGRAEHLQAGAIRIERGQRVRIERARIEDWDRWAIELAAVRVATIDGAEILGADGPDQIGGIRLEGGTQDVRIFGCLVRDAGEEAIRIGAATAPESSLPIHPVGAPKEERLRFEAARVEIERCRLVGGRSAVAFVHALSCSVRTTTIASPSDYVFSVRTERSEGPAPADNLFSQCLITWAPDVLKGFLHVGPGVEATVLRAEENLWWRGTPASSGSDPSAASDVAFTFRLVFPQIEDVDPQLDADLRPANPDASDFGAMPAAGIAGAAAGDGIP